jgi:hypothetical protein
MGTFGAGASANGEAALCRRLDAKTSNGRHRGDFTGFDLHQSSGRLQIPVT